MKILKLINKFTITLTVLLAISYCSTSQTRNIEDIDWNNPEQIRKRNAELLKDGPPEEQIRIDLLHKVIQSSGPEEGSERDVKLSWTVESDEMVRFLVREAGVDASNQFVIKAYALFDNKPRTNDKLEGDIVITYQKVANGWKYVKVRRGQEAMKLERPPAK